MQESARAARSYLWAHAQEFGINTEMFKEYGVHLHIPAGAIPKDGPSAGVTMFTAVASLLLGCSVKGDIAMTGEISLRGNVMPVGGIKEKLLAAHRAGIRHVLIPEKDRRDLDDIPTQVKDEMMITLVAKVDEILPLVLEPPAPSAKAPAEDRTEA